MTAMPQRVTADQFAAELRANGCRVGADHSFTGAVYLQASKPDDPTTVTIVFEGDRFKRAFAVWVGVSRHRWPKFRTMKSIRSFLGIPDVEPVALDALPRRER
ncbi:hypothetical protein OS965_02630 [Streptomyces sp. H27-G5]|uniref:hypothetical protein n=1 Tax=Streptomyces sp. H27-G5 TaxID=2996698 RepID=UPI0022702D3E|nr:hypothetical protein [Streptomyces sp. H27-G5]MCY0917073.1 hypothetical protein [Streptomyces sp. H27-G5]